MRDLEATASQRDGTHRSSQKPGQVSVGSCAKQALLLARPGWRHGARSALPRLAIAMRQSAATEQTKQLTIRQVAELMREFGGRNHFPSWQRHESYRVRLAW